LHDTVPPEIAEAACQRHLTYFQINTARRMPVTVVTSIRRAFHINIFSI
jgi:hypothetical protein